MIFSRTIFEAGGAGRFKPFAGKQSDAAPQNPSGGARRDRTDDLLLAKQALSQLSYGPVRDGNRTSALRNSDTARMPASDD